MIKLLLNIFFPLIVFFIVIFLFASTNIFSNKPVLLYLTITVITIIVFILVLLAHQHKNNIKIPYCIRFQNNKISVYRNAK